VVLGRIVAGDATSASGTPPGDKGILPYKSGIKGTITLGPTCPVMRNPPDPQCADKPYLGLVSIYRASDMTHVIVSKKTNADGTFVVDIAPGDYIVGAGENTLPRCPQTVARVGPNVYTEITISCDTGIR
jgi:hypothetical protein